MVCNLLAPPHVNRTDTLLAFREEIEKMNSILFHQGQMTYKLYVAYSPQARLQIEQKKLVQLRREKLLK
jgi:hypothetical protein